MIFSNFPDTYTQAMGQQLVFQVQMEENLTVNLFPRYSVQI